MSLTSTSRKRKRCASDDPLGDPRGDPPESFEATKKQPYVTSTVVTQSLTLQGSTGLPDDLVNLIVQRMLFDKALVDEYDTWAVRKALHLWTFEEACKKNHPRVVDLMMHECNISLKELRRGFHHAIFEGHEEIVQLLLLDGRVSPDHHTFDFSCTVPCKHMGTLQLLLKSPNFPNPSTNKNAILYHALDQKDHRIAAVITKLVLQHEHSKFDRTHTGRRVNFILKACDNGHYKALGLMMNDTRLDHHSIQVCRRLLLTAICTSNAHLYGLLHQSRWFRPKSAHAIAVVEHRQKNTYTIMKDLLQAMPSDSVFCHKYDLVERSIRCRNFPAWRAIVEETKMDPMERSCWVLRKLATVSRSSPTFFRRARKLFIRHGLVDVEEGKSIGERTYLRHFIR